MRVSTLGQNLFIQQQVARLQERLVESQTQIASGKRADSFSGLRTDSLRVLTLRDELTAINGYKKSISIADTRMTMMQDAFGRMQELGEAASLNAVQARYENETRIPTIQATAVTQLTELVNLTNQSVDGRPIFGGAVVANSPVVDMDLLLEGDPVNKIQGLKDLIEDRIEADNVYDEAEPGRLNVSQSGGPPTITITDANAVDGFGFSITGISEGPLTLTDVSGAAPEQAYALTGFSNLEVGSTVTFELGLPDGTTTAITLTATNDSTEVGLGTFLLGSEESLTAGSVAKQLKERLTFVAQTEMQAASISAAANMLFDNDPPLVIRDAASATPVLEADNPNAPTVVRWYQGDTSATGRDSVQAKADDQTYISYGVRANESPIRDTVKSLAVFASVEYEAGTEGKSMYFSLIERVSGTLSTAGTGLTDLEGEIGVKQSLLVSIESRHESVYTLASTQLSDMESADLYEVSARFNQYRTQLEASYTVTARLNDLSLVNFLR